ncbi:MAG: alpha/beta fold hydrolase [Myxococcales bacterium]|nr:alpha/beta fold hydrolase [Myxococcales bacterium]
MTRRESQDESTFEALLGELARAPARAVAGAPERGLPAGHRVGRYRIGELLGQGGMGAVYRARDEVLGRDVALKVLRVDAAAAGVDRFRREVMALAAVRHPHVVAVHDAGVDAGLPFVVLELVRGQSLRQRLATGPLAVPDAARLAHELIAGLDAAHAVGIVHRDLKPDNILIDEAGAARLVDFGLALLRDPAATAELGATEDGTLLGTAHYMAPEQVRGERVDHRADYFALGAVLYEAVAGRRAFDGRSRADVISAVLRDQPATLPALLTEPAARRLLGVVLRCLDKDAARRFATAAELRDALDGGAAAVPAPAATAVPETRYATSSGVHIAYQVVSPPGPPTLLAAPPFVSNLEVMWESPPEAAWLRALAAFTHFIHYDRRGVGMSDPIAPESALDERVDDLRAVLDAEGVTSTFLLGVSEGGPIAVAFAAAYPERVRGLALMGSFARLTTGDGYPHGLPRAAYDPIIERWVASWGTPQSLSLPLFVASRARDPAFVKWANRYERQCASPGTVRRLLKLQLEMDVRHLLGRVRCPTLVIHRRGDPTIAVDHGRYLAAHIPGARYLEFDGVDHVPWHGDVDGPLAALRDFVLTAAPAPPAR